MAFEMGLERQNLRGHVSYVMKVGRPLDRVDLRMAGDHANVFRLEMCPP